MKPDAWKKYALINRSQMDEAYLEDAKQGKAGRVWPDK
jgi:hypothetical protein